MTFKGKDLQNSFSLMSLTMSPKAHWAEILKGQGHTFSALASLELRLLKIRLKGFCKVR